MRGVFEYVAVGVAKDWRIADAKMLHDEQGAVGKLFKATTTPHVFIVNKGKLVYKGAVDDNGDFDADPKQAKSFLKAALDETIAGKPISVAETEPYGCSVKYAN